MRFVLLMKMKIKQIIVYFHKKNIKLTVNLINNNHKITLKIFKKEIIKIIIKFLIMK